MKVFLRQLPPCKTEQSAATQLVTAQIMQLHSPTHSPFAHIGKFKALSNSKKGKRCFICSILLTSTSITLRMTLWISWSSSFHLLFPCYYTGFHLTENKMVSDGHWDTSIVLVQPHTPYCWTASSVAQMTVLPTLKKKLFPLILQFNLSIQPIHVLSCFSHDMKKIYEW